MHRIINRMKKLSTYPTLTLTIVFYLNCLDPVNCKSADMDESLTLSRTASSSPNGYVYCPPGSLIHHFTISWTKSTTSEKLTRLNEIYFGCYTTPKIPSPKLQLTSKIYSRIVPKNCPKGNFTLTHHSSCQFHGVINGYQLYKAGDTILNARFLCTDETILYSSEVHSYSFAGNASGGVWGAIKKCPFGKAMCGFQTRLHPENECEIILLNMACCDRE